MFGWIANVLPLPPAGTQSVKISGADPVGTGPVSVNSTDAKDGLAAMSNSTVPVCDGGL